MQLRQLHPGREDRGRIEEPGTERRQAEHRAEREQAVEHGARADDHWHDGPDRAQQADRTVEPAPLLIGVTELGPKSHNPRTRIEPLRILPSSCPTEAAQFPAARCAETMKDVTKVIQERFRSRARVL